MKLLATLIIITVSRGKRFLQILFLISFFSNFLIAQNNQTFTIGSIEAKSGDRVSGNLIVKDGIDKGTFIPVTIINGKNSGPVLTLVAGIHGTEFVPVIVLQEIIKKINPEELSGTVILVHVANIPSFMKRTAFFSPGDYKNINRVFPGKPDGTISERVAYTITEEIIRRSDYLIDMHGGEFNEEFIHYAYYYKNCPDIKICNKSNILSKAFGFDYLFIEDYNFVPDSLQPMYCELTALRMGVPATGIELGDRGIVDKEVVDFSIRGIFNVLKTLEMVKGDILKNKSPIFLDDDEIVYSNYDGILYTFVHAGQTVEKGKLIAYTTDFFGNKVEEYYSPISGIVVASCNTPPISKGEIVCWIAKIIDNLE